MSVLQLAFQLGALPTELSLSCYEVKSMDAEILLSCGPRWVENCLAWKGQKPLAHWAHHNFAHTEMMTSLSLN